MSGPQEFETKSSSVIGIDNKTITVDIEITKKPNDAPDDTYFGAAKQILDIPPEGQDGLTREEAIEAIIKRYSHYEKLSTYQKIERYLKEDGSNVRFIVESLIEPKIETHLDFSSRPLNRQIYGRGGWKK